MIVFWCFVLIVLGAAGIVKDLLFEGVGLYDYVINIAIMFVSLGLLFNSYKKSKSKKTEMLLDRIKELEEELGNK